MSQQTSSINPHGGEIWRVQLDPVIGSEQGKTRAVLVMSQPPTGRPSVRLCVILTVTKPAHQTMVWCSLLQPDAANGLSKATTTNAAQARALDLARFESKLGTIGADKVDAVKRALIAVIGGAPPALVEIEAETP